MSSKFAAKIINFRHLCKFFAAFLMQHLTICCRLPYYIYKKTIRKSWLLGEKRVILQQKIEFFHFPCSSLL